MSDFKAQCVEHGSYRPKVEQEIEEAIAHLLHFPDAWWKISGALDGLQKITLQTSLLLENAVQRLKLRDIIQARIDMIGNVRDENSAA